MVSNLNLLLTHLLVYPGAVTDALGLGSVLWLLWTNVTDALDLGSVFFGVVVD